MKKYLAVLFLFALLLTSCSSKLPQWADKAKIEQESKNIIDILGKKDKQALQEKLSPEMKASLSDEQIDAIFQMVAELGSFKEVKAFDAKEAKQNQKSYVTAAVSAAYEKRDVMYTLSFDDQMRLAGLFIK